MAWWRRGGRGWGVNIAELFSVEKDSDCDGTHCHLRGDLPGQVHEGHVPLQEKYSGGGEQESLQRALQQPGVRLPVQTYRNVEPSLQAVTV